MTQRLLSSVQAGVGGSPRDSVWQALERRLLDPLLNLVFPPVCVGCARVDTLLCEHCIASFVPVPVEQSAAPAPFSGKLALGLFDGALQQAVHALKYERLTDMAVPLGTLLAERIREAGWPASVIVPVPLGESRRRERGYNQAALIGAAAADRLGWRALPDALRRVRETRTQVGLDYRERQENVAGAFAVEDPVPLIGCDAVLVDDVYTTGATMRACAAALLEAGVRSVRAATAGQARSST